MYIKKNHTFSNLKKFLKKKKKSRQMQFEAKCACTNIKQFIELEDKHICNCSTCKRYVGGKTCTYFTTPLHNFNLNKTKSYASGVGSKRIFCSNCFTYIGMVYNDHECVYINSSVLDEMPEGLRTYRHIWTSSR